VHFSKKNLKTIEKSFEFLFSLDEYKESDCVIFQGDVFDNRKTLDIEVIDKALEIFQKIGKEKKVYIIMGNHDMYNLKRKEISSLNLLSRMFDNIDIVKEESLIDIEGTKCYMLPYGDVPEEKKVAESDYILGHLEIYPYFPDSEIKESFFKGKKVIMGHQHKFDPYKTPYMGSLFTASFAEKDNQKHFCFIKNKEEFFFVKNEKDRLHLTLNLYNDGFFEIPFLKEKKNIEEPFFLEEYYKYYIKAESAEVMEKFLRILAEREIRLTFKSEIVEKNEEIKENIYFMNPSEYKKNNGENIFSVFENIINEDVLKKELMKELTS
jgi:DNA repair exonuclease SbcCD nuclease subunit